MSITDSAATAVPGALRLAYIDNIRWTMILLVLSMHASDTYSPFGNWYYTEHPPVSLATALTFAFYQSFLQAFFMALLFFIAGYFATPSLRRKGFSAFARERFIRLGLPTLLYMFAIGPVTQYFLSHSWGSGGFVHQWLLHIADGQILSETGPMWFAAVLLAFSWIYAGFRSFSTASCVQKMPLRTYVILLFIAALAVATFLARIALPENVSVLNVHPGDLPQYALMFSAGVFISRSNLLADPPVRLGTRWAISLIVTSLLLFAALVIWGGALAGNTQRYSGGDNAVSFFKCLWESLVCIGMTFALVVLYRRRFHSQNRLAKLLSDNAFAVYLFHPPILIVLALALHGVAAPALVKAAMLTVATTVVAFTLSQLVFRRIPLLQRIL